MYNERGGIVTSEDKKKNMDNNVIDNNNDSEKIQAPPLAIVEILSTVKTVMEYFKILEPDLKLASKNHDGYLTISSIIDKWYVYFCPEVLGRMMPKELASKTIEYKLRDYYNRKLPSNNGIEDAFKLLRGEIIKYNTKLLEQQTNHLTRMIGDSAEYFLHNKHNYIERNRRRNFETELEDDYRGSDAYKENKNLIRDVLVCAFDRSGMQKYSDYITDYDDFIDLRSRINGAYTWFFDHIESSGFDIEDLIINIYVVMLFLSLNLDEDATLESNKFNKVLLRYFKEVIESKSGEAKAVEESAGHELDRRDMTYGDSDNLKASVLKINLSDQEIMTRIDALNVALDDIYDVLEKILNELDDLDRKREKEDISEEFYIISKTLRNDKFNDYNKRKDIILEERDILGDIIQRRHRASEVMNITDRTRNLTKQ